MNRHDELRERYEDALFALLMEDVIETEGQKLLEENERLKQDPSAAVSETVNRRCIQTIKRGFAKERRHTVGRITCRVLNKVAMVAVVCALLFATAFAASPELRAKTLDLLIEVSDTFSTLTLGGTQTTPDQSDSSGSSIETEDLLYGYHIPEVPEGFTVDYQGGGQNSGYIQYINEEGATISFHISKTYGGEFIVDTENAMVQNITIHGYEGLLIEKQYEFEDNVIIDSVMVVWGDTEQSNFIVVDGGNVDKQTILELAEGVEFISAAS